MRDDNLECLSKVFMKRRAKHRKHNLSFTDSGNKSPSTSYSRKPEQADINTPRRRSKRQETGVDYYNVAAHVPSPIIEWLPEALSREPFFRRLIARAGLPPSQTIELRYSRSNNSTLETSARSSIFNARGQIMQMRKMDAADLI